MTIGITKNPWLKLEFGVHAVDFSQKSNSATLKVKLSFLVIKFSCMAVRIIKPIQNLWISQRISTNGTFVDQIHTLTCKSQNDISWKWNCLFFGYQISS